MTGPTQGLILAAGNGKRLQRGPKAFVRLAETTLLEQAVAALQADVDHCLIAVPESMLGQARRLLPSPSVSFLAGGRSRSHTTRLLLEQSTAPWLVLHDVVHPFIPPGIVPLLLECAIRAGAAAAAPGLVNRDFLFTHAAELCARPGQVLLAQKPVVVQRSALIDAVARSTADDGVEDPGVNELLAAAGHRTQFLPGSSCNFKITTAADLELAEALLQRLGQPQPGGSTAAEPAAG
jgi:2-C-methyl-D-erythritol 4-phosphate cytidylyltransferase